MNISQIQALNGEGFDIFLELLIAEAKTSGLQDAWQILQQKVDLFSENTEVLDLNEIFVEVMTLKLLIAPILEDTHHPLKGEEWQQIPAQLQNTLTQLKRVQKYLAQTQSEETDFVKLLTPLFDQLKVVYREMGTYWQWYQQQWKEFQKPDSDEANDQKDIKEPPFFNRTGWAVAQLSFKALVTELQFRKKKKVSFLDQSHMPDYPIFQLLIKEVQELAENMESFELLEKIQLAQKRNEQLAQQLQPFYGVEPILVKNIAKPSQTIAPSSGISRESNLKYRKKPTKKTNKKLLLLLAFLIVLILGVLSQLSQPPSTPNGIESESTSDAKLSGVFSKQFVPSRIDPESGAKNTEGQLLQMLQTNKMDMAVYAIDDNLKKMIEAEKIPKKALKKMMTELKQPVVLFADESAAYLASAEDLIRYDSLKELQKLLDAIAEYYQEMLETVETLENELLQYEVSVVVLDQEQPGYSLLLRNANNQVVGQIGFSSEGLQLQWQNMENVLTFATVRELVDAVKTLEKF